MSSNAHEIEVSITIAGDPPVKLPGRVMADGQRVVRTSAAVIVIPQPDRVDVYRNGVVAQVYAHDHSAGRPIDTVSYLGPDNMHLCYYLGPGGELILTDRTDAFVQVKRT